jgi:hypothetical protein
MSDIDPFIDWAADADVTQVKKILDADALAKGWIDAKVAGVSRLSVPCEAVDVCTMTAYLYSVRQPSVYYAHFNHTLSVDAERAFSACTLMLGKLRTCLSDESFRAGLLLRSWHKAGLLPKLEEMVQCLRDGDAATAAQAKRAKRRHIDQEPVGRTPRKKARTDTHSSDSNA